MVQSKIIYSGPIPAGVSNLKAISLLHDHAAFFQAAQSYREHIEVPYKGKLDSLPSEIRKRSVDSASGTAVKAYTVRNEVPNPFCDSIVDSAHVVVDLVDGLWYFVTSPLGVISEVLWTARKGRHGLELCVTLQVECNMLLMTMVKSQVSSSSQQIHKALLARMQC